MQLWNLEPSPNLYVYKSAPTPQMQEEEETERL